MKLFSRTNWVYNILALCVLFIGLNNSTGTGFYNFMTGEIACNSRAICLHEITHKYDHSQGWISKTEKYQHSILVYRTMLWLYPDKRDENSRFIYEFPGIGSAYWDSKNPASTSFWQGGWGGYTELYASIIEWSNGDPNKCPRELRAWYDWNYLQVEMEKLGYGR